MNGINQFEWMTENKSLPIMIVMVLGFKDFKIKK